MVPIMEYTSVVYCESITQVAECAGYRRQYTRRKLFNGQKFSSEIQWTAFFRLKALQRKKQMKDCNELRIIIRFEFMKNHAILTSLILFLFLLKFLIGLECYSRNVYRVQYNVHRTSHITVVRYWKCWYSILDFPKITIEWRLDWTECTIFHS